MKKDVFQIKIKRQALQELGAANKTKRQSKANQPLIIIAKGTTKKAVERSLLKRRIRAIIRGPLKKDAKDLTIIARPGASSLSFKELKSELESKLKRPTLKS